MATWANNPCSFRLLFLVIFGLYQVTYSVAAGAPNACNVFEGSWVFDKSYPLYDNNTCPFVEKEFNCQKNGRPDTDYLKYRWQPTKCNLPRFDGEDFLRRYRGKKIMFVGDSLTRDMWASLTCLLYTSAPNLSYKLIRVGLVSNFTIPEYNITVWLDRSSFLVDLIDTPSGNILKLDSIRDGKNWLGMDMLIFNTWHWWGYRHKAQVWDYISVNNTLLKDMDRTEALKIAMQTWGHWVDANINPNKTKVFWQGISPNHYTGKDWGETKANKCAGQTRPVLGPKYPGYYPSSEVNVVKTALSKVKNPVTLLDITGMSLLRKDGHPSFYGVGGKGGQDCTHWCVGGVPDAWNQILYSFASHNSIHSSIYIIRMALLKLLRATLTGK